MAYIALSALLSALVTAVVPGLLTGLSLIIAIGAQNAFVLRQGIRGHGVWLVVAICALSDVALIVAGVAGIGTVIEHASGVIDVVRWAGVAFLVWYGVTSLLRARHPEALEASASTPTSTRQIALTALALTWLNPHVYLDTVLLLGSIATTHGPEGRWWFALGAATASIIWFAALGHGARLVAPLLARPAAWRVLDLVIGVTMLVIAVRLAAG